MLRDTLERWLKSEVGGDIFIEIKSEMRFSGEMGDAAALRWVFKPPSEDGELLCRLQTGKNWILQSQLVEKLFLAR